MWSMTMQCMSLVLGVLGAARLGQEGGDDGSNEHQHVRDEEHALVQRNRLGAIQQDERHQGVV